MTPAERKAAAHVMASEGPWDVASQGKEDWNPCAGEPCWNWTLNRYRIRPAPAPEPMPCCPTCGTEGLCKDSRYHYCSACNTKWREDRRVPCPSCADLRDMLKAAKRDVQRACIHAAAADFRAELLEKRDQSCPTCAALGTARSLLVTGPGWNQRLTMDHPVSVADGTMVALVNEHMAAPPPCPVCAAEHNKTCETCEHGANRIGAFTCQICRRNWGYQDNWKAKS